MEKEIQLLKYFRKINNIVFYRRGCFSSKWYSDFRSMGGLFDEISKDGQSPEYLLSVDHLNDDKESFIDFYHKRLLIADKSQILYISGLLL